MRRISHTASIDPLEQRRLLSVSFKPRTGELLVQGTPGHDVITIEPHDRLLNMMSVRLNDQVRLIAYGAVKKIMVSGGAGNDAITLDDGTDVMPSGYAIHIRGNKGNDRIIVGELKPTSTQGYLRVEGNEGNDHIEVNGQASVNGGDGDDYIRAGTLRTTGWTISQTDSGGASRGAAVIHGDAGNDTLVGGAWRDSIYGGAGNDRIYGGDESDRLDGGDGDDVLYPIGPDLTRTYWVGRDTGYGGAGRDWFYPETRYWSSTDYNPAEDHRFGTPDPDYTPGSLYFGGHNSGNFGGGFGGGSHSTSDSAVKYVVSLVSLGDTGFAVTRQRLQDQNDEQLTGARELGEVPYRRWVGLTKPQRTELRQLTEPAALTSAERRTLRPGLLRLGAEMSLGEAIPARDGLTWYRVNHTPAQGESELHVMAVVLKQGSVIVAGDAGVSGTIESTRLFNNTKFTRDFDVIAASGTTSFSRVGISPWSQIEIVGSGARYETAREMPEGIRIRGGADRQGILAQGGVIWLPKDNESAYFTRLWR